MGTTDYLSALNWGQSTGGAAGSAETTSTLGQDPLDTRQPPSQYYVSLLQIARIKNLVLSMSQYFKGGTRLQVLKQSSNPFGGTESGFYVNTSGTAYVVVDGTQTAIGAGGGVSLSVANTWTASQNVAKVALTDGATINTDASLGNVFSVTLADNRTLANPTNLVSGGVYQWVVSQDATGSRTLAYGNLFKWPGGIVPTLTTTASAVDVITAVYNGTILAAVWQGDFR